MESLWFFGVRRGIAALGFCFLNRHAPKKKIPKRRCLAALHIKAQNPNTSILLTKSRAMPYCYAIRVTALLP